MKTVQLPFSQYVMAHLCNAFGWRSCGTMLLQALAVAVVSRLMFSDIFNPFGYLLSVLALCIWQKPYLAWGFIFFAGAKIFTKRPLKPMEILLGADKPHRIYPWLHCASAPIWALVEVARYFGLVRDSHYPCIFLLQNACLLASFILDTSYAQEKTMTALNREYNAYLKALENAHASKSGLFQIYYEDCVRKHFDQMKDLVAFLAGSNDMSSFNYILESIHDASVAYKRKGCLAYSWVLFFFDVQTIQRTLVLY